MSILQDIIQYSEDVISGKQIACVKHVWACKRLIKDLEKQGTKDFPWVFDEEKAQKFIDWMGFFKHTKGPLTGQYKIAEPIEKFIFGQIYGWVHMNTGYRRFRKGYWQVGRKNAKSQDLAIQALYEISAFGEPYAEAYIAATKKDQTRYVWGEADLISKGCEYLKGKIFTKFYQPLSTTAILHPKSGSFFARMSKDDKKKGDGSNPQFGALDEYHAHDTAEFYDVLTSGMKTRKQPLLMIITTAGFELNNPCYKDEYKYVSDILNPDSEIENDRYLVMINELDMDEEGNLIDDIRDERNWEKPNPIVVKTSEGLEAIRDELQVALDKPDKMRDFLTKTMNVWVNQRAAGYMNLGKWKQCGIKQKDLFELIKGLEVTIGFDLSAKIDLTSTGFEIPLPDGRIAILSHSFMPEATLFTKMKSDKVPYDRWAKEDWITITPGASVDYKFMMDYVKKFVEKHGLIVKELCFDRYLAERLMPELSEEGYEVIDIPQGIPTLGEPTKDFRDQTYDGKIVHENNPVLNWAMGNAVVRKDHNDNIMLDKSKSTERIDPVASLMNSHVRVWLKKDNTSVYEERGVRGG
ncbi:MAG: Terminase [Clostridia bacterium]|jgi:phage terminase large subunit-like protein|nr:Terminase [Clostridia bacterium]